MTSPGFYMARGAQVWHGSQVVDSAGPFRALRLGFIVATTDPNLDDRADAARQIAAGLNLIQRIDGLAGALASAEAAGADVRDAMLWIDATRRQLAGSPALQVA